jgi:DNA-binding transcriptional LysR family regulator
VTIQQLKFFYEVCQRGSIAAAAEHLFITPSGLSMALHRMEKELSCKLFTRNSRGVYPTSDGIFLLSHATEILKHVDACDDFFDADKNRSNTVVLALAANIPDEYIGDLVTGFNVMSKTGKVVLKTYPGPVCDSAVESGEAEMGFNTGPFCEEKFSWQPVIACPLRLLINKSHEYAALDFFPTAYLHNMGLVIRESKTPYETELFVRCRVAGVQPYIVQEAGDSLMVFNMIHRNPQYFGVVPKSAADVISLPDVKAVGFEDPNFIRTVYMFKKLGSTLTTLTEEFEEFVIHNAIPSSDNAEPARKPNIRLVR